MDKLQKILIVLCELLSWSRCSVYASMLEKIVRPGDNITVYCDCKISTGIYIVWLRNCSHEYQPTLVADWKKSFLYERENRFPRFRFVKNESSKSFDLMIINVTSSDEGLYYCGTLETKVEKNKDNNIFSKEVYIYGNLTTRITLYAETHFPHPNISMTVEECGLCWNLLISLCPTVSAFSGLLLIFLLCQNPANIQAKKKRDGTLRQALEKQDEKVCCAALEICQASGSQKKKITIQNSDFNMFTTVMYVMKVGELKT